MQNAEVHWTIYLVTSQSPTPPPEREAFPEQLTTLYRFFFLFTSLPFSPVFLFFFFSFSGSLEVPPLISSLILSTLHSIAWSVALSFYKP